MSKNKLHLAIVARDTGNPGSVAYVTNQYGIYLSQYFDVSIISDSFSLLPSAINEIRVTQRDFNFMRRFCHVPNEVSFCVAAGKALKELHASKPVDVMFTRSHGVATLVFRAMKKSSGIPYVLHPPGDIFYRPPKAYDFLLTLFYKMVTRPANQYADLILASSEHMKEISKGYGVDEKNILLAPHGMDLSSLGITDDDIVSRMAVSPDSRENLHVIYVGRLAKEKGIMQLLDAARMLVKVKRLEFDLKIIGSGPLEQEVVQYIENHSLQDYVTFAGRIPRQRLGEQYIQADVTCMPSIDEPYGLVAVESMICGTPVIAANVGGLATIIEDGKTGALIPTDSSIAIADIIEDLDKDRDLLFRWSAEGRKSSLKRFSWKTVVSNVAKAIEGC